MSTAPALLVTRDDLLLDDVLRLAAAAGCRLDVAHDTTSALRGWSAACLVLVGTDLVDALAVLHPPRRDHVHVVGSAPATDPAFRGALGVGAADVVELPAAEPWLVELLTDAADQEGGRGVHRGHVLGVVAGSGGAGATVFACALALTSARHRVTALVDLDPLGPGVERVVGLERTEGVRWDTLTSSRGRLGSRSLRAALPTTHGLGVLTWPLGVAVDLDPASLREVLSALGRGHDLVVIDLPRSQDELSVEAVARCDWVLVVVEASIPGVAAAGRLATALGPLTDGLGAVVRTGPRSIPASQVAEALALPLVAEVPRQRRLGEHLDLGLGPVHSARSPLGRAAAVTLAAGEADSGAA